MSVDIGPKGRLEECITRDQLALVCRTKGKTESEVMMAIFLKTGRIPAVVDRLPDTEPYCHVCLRFRTFADDHVGTCADCGAVVYYSLETGANAVHICVRCYNTRCRGGGGPTPPKS